MIEADLCLMRSEGVRGVSAEEASRQRVCYLDGKPLEGRRVRWCSDPCWQRWFRNHGWNDARAEATRRAGGHGRFSDDGQTIQIRPWCDECRQPTDRPEVNHVEPRNGAGYFEGCHNHQTNLQLLCHACHVAETTRQVRERLGIPVEGRPRLAGTTADPGEALPEPLWGAA